jgi:hypothetical protein
MQKQKYWGKCAICGIEGPLTKEHVPPQKAFNDKSFISVPQKAVENLRYDQKPRAKPIQGGVHYYSICQRCNNSTGSWYGESYVTWAYEAYRIGQASNFKPTLLHLHLNFPLRIIKQVVTMFFSVNQHLSKQHPELVKFVLNKEEKYLPNRIQIYAYYNFEGNLRYNSVTVAGPSMSVFSEIAFPPLGFVICYDNSPPPDDRMYNISFFAESGYNEFREVTLHMPALPTHLQVAGTYLTKKEIEENYRQNAIEKVAEMAALAARGHTLTSDTPSLDKE